jgi:hypothetical protein
MGSPCLATLVLASSLGARADSEAEQTKRQLLREAIERQGRNATGNGKFPLSTGAWFMTEQYVSKAKQKCSDCMYMLDASLADCLSRFFEGRTITELGAGVGRYAKHIRESGLTGRVVAYDGMPDVETKSGGAVLYADLSTKENSIETSDWAMTLEVAEHVPKQFEATFLGNIDKANRIGVVLSWSRLQGSRGHVNPKGPRAVIAQFQERGYEHDRNATRKLRKCAKHPNFRSCLLVFRHQCQGQG